MPNTLRFIPLLLLVGLCWSCDTEEQITFTPFELEGQYLEFTTTAGETYRLTEQLNNQNWSILYYDDEGLNSAFVRRWKTEPYMSSALNFSPDSFGPEAFDAEGKPDLKRLSFPYAVWGTFSVTTGEGDEQVSYDGRRVRIHLDGFEDNILSGRFEHDSPPAPGSVDLVDGSFRVFFQLVRVD